MATSSVTISTIDVRGYYELPPSEPKKIINNKFNQPPMGIVRRFNSCVMIPTVFAKVAAKYLTFEEQTELASIIQRLADLTS